MSYTTDKIARLQAQLDSLDEALVSTGAGTLTYVQVGTKQYRFSEPKEVLAVRAGIEAQLSMLEALKRNGGRTHLRKRNY
jgi:hypothetical protein